MDALKNQEGSSLVLLEEEVPSERVDVVDTKAAANGIFAVLEGIPGEP